MRECRHPTSNLSLTPAGEGKALPLDCRRARNTSRTGRSFRCARLRRRCLAGEEFALAAKRHRPFYPRAPGGGSGIKPSPEADKNRWLRRVTYDLTGLPPTPCRGGRFSARTHRPMLMKKSWTACSLQNILANAWRCRGLTRHVTPTVTVTRATNSAPTWPFRDWVVDAFNDNHAGTTSSSPNSSRAICLPNPTRRQRLATAFNRLHRQTNEGGSIEEEWRTEYVADQVPHLRHHFSRADL